MSLTLVLGVGLEYTSTLEMHLTLHSAQNSDRKKTQRVRRYHQLHLCALVHGSRWR